MPLKLCLLIGLYALINSAQAAIKLPSIISHHMVLQYGQPIHLWGSANPHEQITAKLGRYQTKTNADAQGQWQLYLHDVATGQYQLTLKTQTDQRTIHDVLVGEVWLASGQSNMEWPVAKSGNAAHYIRLANQPNIRFFEVEKSTHLTPQSDTKGHWRVLSPETAPNVSAVAYHFAQQLHQQLKAPIGIIQSTWGNTQIQTWTPANVFQENPELNYLWRKVLKDTQLSPEEKQAHENQRIRWEQQNLTQDIAPHSIRLPSQYTKWQAVNLPTTFNTIGFKQNGAIWFKKDIILPEHWLNKTTSLELGKIDDFDTTYINGVRIGHTDRDTPFHWLSSRRYVIPQGILKTGLNTIWVRVFDQYSDGGFTSSADTLRLQQADEFLSLAGEWHYHIESAIPEKAAHWASKPPAKFDLHNHNTPSVLFNTMIAPLTPYAIRGIIWYQGEADVSRAKQYATLFPQMIHSWRHAWKQNLPFGFVQLANFDANPNQPNQHPWAELRAAQTATHQATINTEMVTAIDVGEANNIHPKDKFTVGSRLANWAITQVYKRFQSAPEPVIQNIHLISQQAVQVSFIKGMKLKQIGEITAFELADEQGQWHPAHAKLNEQGVQVWTQNPIQSTAIRYAWKNNPKANIYNQYNRPLQPFWHTLAP